MFLHIFFLLFFINLSCTYPEERINGSPPSTGNNNYIVSLRKDIVELHPSCSVNTSALDDILAPCNRRIPSVVTFSLFDAQLVLCMGVYDSILRICDLNSKPNNSLVDSILASRGNTNSVGFCTKFQGVLELVNTEYTQTNKWVKLLKQNLRNASICDRACIDMNGDVNPLCSFIYEANVIISSFDGSEIEEGANLSNKASPTANVDTNTNAATKNVSGSKSSKVSGNRSPDAKDRTTSKSTATKKENSGQDSLKSAVGNGKGATIKTVKSDQSPEEPKETHTKATNSLLFGPELGNSAGREGTGTNTVDAVPVNPVGKGEAGSTTVDAVPVNPAGKGEAGTNTVDAVPGNPLGKGEAGSTTVNAVPVNPVGKGEAGSTPVDAVPVNPVGKGEAGTNTVDAVPGNPLGKGEAGSTTVDAVPVKPVGKGEAGTNTVDAVPGNPVGKGEAGTNTVDAVPGNPLGKGEAGTTTVDDVNSSPGSTQPVENKETTNVQPVSKDAVQPPKANTGDDGTQIEPEPSGMQTDEHNSAPFDSNRDALSLNDNVGKQSYVELDDDFPVAPPKRKDHTIAKVTNGAVLPVSEGTNFVDAEDSHFFVYFVTMVVLCVIGYLVFHNKQKILALTLEGRSRRSSRRRQSATKYKKLDSNLEEAVTSACKQSTTSIIY